MESLSKLQLDTKSNIDKGRSNFKKSPKDRLTQSYIETRLETLESQWTDFVRTHRNIIEIATDEDRKSKSYFTKDIYEKTEDIYTMYKSELKELKPNPSTDKHVQVDNFNVKLPTIGLPKFSGQYSEWNSFRDLFLSLIDKNYQIDEVQKLHYLKAHLSGEAAQLLKHTPITASNYKESWSVLMERYDNKKHLANCILKRLVNQPVIKESSASVKGILDTTVECLKALRALGINVDSWDVIVIFLVRSKLDVESRKLWEREISTSDKLPTFVEFKKFLESRFRSLENIDEPSNKQNVTNTNNRNNSAKSFHVASKTCVLCSEEHKLCHCKQFAKKDTDERREFVRTNKLCFNCLGPNHNVYHCRQSTKCQTCKKKHHTLLHPKPIAESTESKDGSAEQSVVVAAATTSTQSECTKNICLFTDVTSQGLLATALVNVRSRTGTAVVLRALMDQGSQVSFITEAAVQMLGLRKTPARTDILRLGDDEGTSMPSRWIVKFQLQSRLDPTFVLKVDAYVLSKLTSQLPERKVVQVLSTFSSFELADPTFDTPGKIDLLLSTRVVSEVLLEGLVKGPPGTPVAQKTKLGWILSGEIQSNPGKSSPVCCHAIAGTDTNELLRRFWELESDQSLTPKVILTTEEQSCEDFYSATTQRDATGRYIVKLPFKSTDHKCLYGESEAIALKRFHMLERRLLKDPELQTQYSAAINEYLELGHAEVVPQAEKGTHAVYLPHHAVVRNDKSTTKVRVVFDASCPGSNGVSLNDDLMVGPTLQRELRQIIMRWRCHRISLVADIVKMYRQVKVSESDVDYQRILWRNNPGSELQHLRLLRVTFGTSSAPYLAVRTLQQLAHDDGKDFPLATNRVLNDFFVDDLLSGCDTIDESAKIYVEMNELLGRGGFQLQKWSSNSVEFLQKVTTDSVGSRENLEFKVDDIVKILGLSWDKKSDEFKYTVHLPQLNLPVTKRRLISDIARLFDPLGWIAPVVTTAKVLIQRVWLSGVGWDDELPDSLLKDWLSYRSTLHILCAFHIPRWFQTSPGNTIELQGFSDASNAAYAAVVYVRSVNCDGTVHVSLVASKTKVAPVKVVSIPRLELCGAVLLSKLLSEVSGTLGIGKEQIHAWTDSSVVLAWLSSHPSRWNTFVSNRVSEILTTTECNQWSHVQSKDNPADCASRGMNPLEFVEFELWRNGPSWLKDKNINYNRGIIEKTNLEERKGKHLVLNAVVNESKENSIITKFSSLKRLVRVIAICRRFLRLAQKNRKPINTLLSFTEINLSLFTCIKICQLDHFEEEIISLRKTGEVNKRSKLSSLNPYLDSDHILRVGGRLHRANIHEDMKHPIIIPHMSHFTTLLIADAHERTLHGGPQLVLNYLRSQYWIVNARGTVRSYVRKCVSCIRFSARGITPLMGQLPSARVNAHRPFYRSGVDYAGPISVRPTKGRGYHATKGYICLFVCMATRAIHLEIVSDMTSQSFLAAFKRFTARRGHCRELWSDNGTTFVGADKELRALFRHERSGVAPEIVDWLATNGTEWHFIPPHSPNFGGLWEAGVKSTKHHLRRVIGTSTLTFEEMMTVLAQIEACLNSRPISAISTNPEDPCPLTPGHFLVGEPLLLVPESNFENSNISTLKRWQLTQRMLQDFWRRWSSEYLIQFHHRHKWSHQTPEPKVGDVVLVMEDDLPPARWLYGLIVEKHTGSDKVTRVVSLRCKGSIIRRPVSKLIVLPVSNM